MQAWVLREDAPAQKPPKRTGHTHTYAHYVRTRARRVGQPNRHTTNLNSQT